MPKTTKRPNGRTREQMSADMKQAHLRKKRSEGQKRRYAALRAAQHVKTATAAAPTYTSLDLAMAMHCQAWLNTGPRELVRMVLNQITRQ